VDINAMHGSAQPDDRLPPGSAEDMIAATNRSASVGDNSHGGRVLEETELNSALQLLVERAQYITGATGTALALPQGEEMVCRASAGSAAPAVGARLQVVSGLTGESISRRQLLRCDNAESDPRVNLEACRALGIASIVVLPLLRHNGEVRGLFELFSDHPYAFEERDLVALERMADLTLTALDLAEQRQIFTPAPAPAYGKEPEKPVDSLSAKAIPMQPESAASPVPSTLPPVISPVTTTLPAPASVPEAMLRVQKCASCGFPVSEGRNFCLDCEKKESDKKTFETKQREQEEGRLKQQTSEPPTMKHATIHQGEREQGTTPDSSAAKPEEFVPAFLVNAGPAQESWWANHVNLLAIAVLIMGILVAVVVFR
jgi:putative methionine-R-sulfoxide reductase with GAF domain